jgi:integrase
MAGMPDVDLYLATRHYFGWYAFNVLLLDDMAIAAHLGHRDGGKLVRTVYGHADKKLARARVREAFERAPAAPIPLVAAVG